MFQEELDHWKSVNYKGAFIIFLNKPFFNFYQIKKPPLKIHHNQLVANNASALEALANQLFSKGYKYDPIEY